MALPVLKGRVAWVFAEDDFDIDLIVGIRNIKLQDAEALAAVAMQRFEADFRSQVRPGDLLVGGRNFGYGHPHYPAMKAMRHMGIRGVIAESFSPGYWRGEVAMGFPQLACLGVLAHVQRWDELEVDWATGRVINHTQGLSLPFDSLAQADHRMLEAGGLFNWLQAELSGR
jgi:3-isopropylmalate/(R)-2-methylmalate dehydratase small subunit